MASFSFLNGLSQAGKDVSAYAGEVGLQAQKADLARQQLELADSLIGARESTGRLETAGYQAQRDAAQNTFLAGQSDLDRQNKLTTTGMTTAAQLEHARIMAGTMPPEVKSAEWFAGASDAQKQAYREELAAKAGLPTWMTAGAVPPSGTPPSTTSAPSGATPGAPSTTPPAGAPDAAPSNRNDGALEGLPAPAASIVKGMVEGRIAPPTSFAMAKPYWQTMMQKAAEYDPSFDQTTWAGRVATRKDFSSGQAAKAVTAMNTALAHAGTLADDFEKLGNYGGVATVLNQPANAIGKAFGDARQTKVQQTIDALASEARKVFAAAGGGNLTELLEWQKSFPLNGSPDQQKAALTGFVDLLDGRLSALADQYNRGMGRTDDPINLLQPSARKVYERLTGREPKEATGYQLGKPPGAGPAATSRDAETGIKIPELPAGFRIIQ